MMFNWFTKSSDVLKRTTMNERFAERLMEISQELAEVRARYACSLGSVCASNFA